jgi:hypothetical protein
VADQTITKIYADAVIAIFSLQKPSAHTNQIKGSNKKYGLLKIRRFSVSSSIKPTL